MRLALLEQFHQGNKDSLIAVHKCVSELKSEIKEDMRIGFQDLREDLQQFTKEAREQSLKCSAGFEKRLSILEGWRNWLTGAYVATAAIFAAWVNHKGRAG